MQYTILLNKDEKTKDTEVQEQARFVKSILEALNVPVDWNPYEPLSVDNKIKFRKSLNAYDINVIDDQNGGLKIFAKNELIGEWFKCKYKLKEDLSQKDPNKRLYLEMGVNFWSIFEKTE
jgi:hypothetical protein